MSQGKLSFKATKQKKQNPKSVVPIFAENDKVESLKSADIASPGGKRKYVSSPESSSPANPPRTGYRKSKRQEKRVRRAVTPSSPACKTLFDYMLTEKLKVEFDDDVKNEGKDTDGRKEATEEQASQETNSTGKEDSLQKAMPIEESTVILSEDKATQNDETLLSAKSFLKRVTQPKEEPIPNKVAYKTTGAKMLAAALAKKREGVPAHKNEVIRALAARRELAVGKPDNDASGRQSQLNSSSSKTTNPTSSKLLLSSKSQATTSESSKNESERDSVAPGASTPPKLSARARFAHLLKPVSPKIKPFKAISVSSPTKSPAKEQLETGLALPETYKSLHSKFGTSDQVVNLLTRRQETCTFQKLQKNVQEISRKRFNEEDLSHIHGLYPDAYIFAQAKGLSQIRNDRTIRNEYQLTIAFNYAETEQIKKSKTTNILGLHPSLNPTRKLQFEDSNKITENEKITLDEAKDKHAFNQRGLIVSELLERGKRFHRKLLAYVRAAHQIFLGTLVPALNIDDDKLVRWHPEFDLNGLELPPRGELPQPPVSTRILSATEMLISIDSNKSTPPPGMQEAVDKNLQKILADKQEQLEKKAQDKLKGLDPALVARIRAKEANKIALKMTRDPQKDKEMAMLERLEPVVRCLRVLYVSAGKGSLLLQEVTQEISSNPRVSLAQHSVDEHIRLLISICPNWLSVANIRKKEYLKLNRNFDTNIVLNEIQNKLNQLKS